MDSYFPHETWVVPLIYDDLGLACCVMNRDRHIRSVSHDPSELESCRGLRRSAELHNLFVGIELPTQGGVVDFLNADTVIEGNDRGRCGALAERHEAIRYLAPFDELGCPVAEPKQRDNLRVQPQFVAWGRNLALPLDSRGAAATDSLG